MIAYRVRTSLNRGLAAALSSIPAVAVFLIVFAVLALFTVQWLRRRSAAA